MSAACDNCGNPVATADDMICEGCKPRRRYDAPVGVVALSPSAAEVVERSGLTLSDVRDDVEAIGSGGKSRATLLAEHVLGSDTGRTRARDWIEYVDAVCAAAGVGRATSSRASFPGPVRNAALESGALPSWLGVGRAEKLWHGERLIRLTSGRLAGEVAIVCPSDPDDQGVVTDLVYTRADWEATGPASLTFDRDGDLCESTPDGTASTRVVSYEEWPESLAVAAEVQS